MSYKCEKILHNFANDEKERDLIKRGQQNLEFVVNGNVIVNRYILAILVVFIQPSCLSLWVTRFDVRKFYQAALDSLLIMLKLLQIALDIIDYCVIIFFYMSFGSLKANFESLLTKQPHSTNVNHSMLLKD